MGEYLANFMRRRPSLIPSRYIKMIWVPSSSIIYSRRSSAEAFDALPMEMNLLSPMPSLAIWFMILIPTPPLCDIIDTLPTWEWGSNLAKGTQKPFSMLMAPMLFGPEKRISYFSAMVTICCSNALPSSLYSLKPAVSMMARCTPFWPHSSRISGTNLAGTNITAKST